MYVKTKNPLYQFLLEPGLRSLLRPLRFLLAVSAVLIFVLLVNSGFAVGGTFEPTGTLSYERASHTATVLPDGSVIVTGGFGPRGGGYEGELNSAELFDPASETWSAIGNMNEYRTNHSATFLNDGRLLIAGGGYTDGTASTEIYDPVTGTFLLTVGPMVVPRSDHVATLLIDGRVLITGGTSRFGDAISSAEIFDPDTGVFTLTAESMEFPRLYHAATLLNNGKVLLTGGRANNPGGGVPPYSADAEVFDPATATFSRTAGSMLVGREHHTATRLVNGTVLVAGGITPWSATVLSSTELYNQATNTFMPGAEMGDRRFGHSATILDEDVLIVGGDNVDSSQYQRLASAEVYDASTLTFSPAGSTAVERIGHTASSLQDGRVLVTAGHGNSYPWYLATAELYTHIVSVEIDIKPDGSPNSINPSRGVIPVAILTKDDFDAITVDPLSVRFGPSGASEKHGKGHMKDVDFDGYPDLVLHFLTQETGIQCGDISAFLIGETVDGQKLEGSDSIRTVACK